MGIAERLREALDALGVSVAEASRASGIPYRSMQNYLRSEREPNAEALRALNAHLGISVDWLLSGNGQFRVAGGRVEESLPPYRPPDPQEQAIVELYRALDEDARRDIRDAAQEKKRIRDLEQRLKDVEAMMATIRRA